MRPQCRGRTVAVVPAVIWCGGVDVGVGTSWERGRRAAKVVKAIVSEILSEWTAFLGTRNFTLLHQILDQLREITDPYARIP